jgi:hypothetical protein
MQQNLIIAVIIILILGVILYFAISKYTGGGTKTNQPSNNVKQGSNTQPTQQTSQKPTTQQILTQAPPPPQQIIAQLPPAQQPTPEPLDICFSAKNGGLCKSELSTNSHRFVLQDDGNVVVYRKSDNTPIWASKTQNKGVAPYRMYMQTDGNLVVYDKNNNAIWASDTLFGNGPYQAKLSTNGDVIVIDNSGASKIVTVPPINCVISEWSSCDTNTMQQNAKILIEPNKYGMPCGDLVKQCGTFTRQSYAPKCDDGLIQSGNSCYKRPDVKDSQISGTTYIKDCPSNTWLEDDSCVYTADAYRPTKCPPDSSLAITAAGVLTGNCEIKSYNRPSFTRSPGAWGDDSLSKCQTQTGTTCEMIGSTAYPKCKDGYYPNSLFPQTCSPEGGNGYSKDLGPAECNSGDIQYNRECYPAPLPNFIAESTPTQYTNGVTNKLKYKTNATRLNFEIVGDAKCNPGDDYSPATKQCYVRPPAGYNCDGPLCKLV